MISTLENKLIVLIREGRAMQQTYKAEIESCEDADTDIEAGLTSLEDALSALQRDPEEHANSSAANYKDYMAEERATTDMGSD